MAASAALASAFAPAFAPAFASASGIEAVAAEYGADEVMVVTITYDHAARRRSYELIAEAFGLS